MNLESEVEKVLREHPDIIIKALETRPDLLYALLLKLAPWDRLASREDLRALVEHMDRRFEDLVHHVDKRFEDLLHYVDKRFEEVNRRIGLLEKIVVGINAPILAAVVGMLLKLLVGAP